MSTHRALFSPHHTTVWRFSFLAALLSVTVALAGTVIHADTQPGVSDEELYAWWSTMCTNHQKVIATADQLQPTASREDIIATLTIQQHAFAEAEKDITAATFTHPTLKQRQGLELVLMSYNRARQQIGILPLATVEKETSPSFQAVAARQLRTIYEVYVEQLALGLDKIGAGSPTNVNRIRALPQCSPFLYS